MTYKFLIHYGLHLIFPLFIALIINRKQAVKIYFILIATMLVDIDHIFASPVFNPDRCSINFHPLHTYFAMVLYFLALFNKKIRIVAIGLIWHMITDFIDCNL